MMADHTFAVPAYGRSPHLEACLDSLRAQDLTSHIVVATSTPFPGFERLVESFGALPVVHGPNRGIGADWNAALAQCRTNWCTLAHQDDFYEASYTTRMLEAGERHRDTLIVFSDYVEVSLSGVRAKAAMPAIKRKLLWLGFLGRDVIRSRATRRMALRFGNAIACPAVMFHVRQLKGFAFRNDLRVNLDWAAWLTLADREGAFVRVKEPLVQHRIHAGSESSATLDDGTRRREDLLMLEALWPGWIARTIQASYRLAYAAADKRGES